MTIRMQWTDGKIRCHWVSPTNTTYLRYHDEEWAHDGQDGACRNRVAAFLGDGDGAAGGGDGLGELCGRTSVDMFQPAGHRTPVAKGFAYTWQGLPRIVGYCMHMSHKHSSIQYEGVTTMAKDGYGEMSCISCCVSPLDPENEEQRHNIQYFGARVNVLKALLTGLNGGYDDVHKDYKVFDIEPVRDEVLDFDTVKANFEKSLDWLTDTYVDALNIIHYMTDKYNYEAVQMAFLPTHQRANMGFGICGFANTVDTLSAIKYATVKPIRDENGYIYDYETIGEYPRWGEDDPRSNELAEWLIEAYTTRLRSHKLYKNAEATVSLLTITSNVAYSKQTGNSPVHKGVYLNEDGSVNLSKLEFFSPGANPSNKAKGGWLQNLNSLASLDFGYAADGISLTTQVSPRALGKTRDEQVDNLVTILDGYFENGGQHVNLNVMDLNDVYEKIMSGEDVIVRISGYCVNTKYLTPEQKTELTQRVFHEVLSMDDALS